MTLTVVLKISSVISICICGAVSAQWIRQEMGRREGESTLHSMHFQGWSYEDGTKYDISQTGRNLQRVQVTKPGVVNVFALIFDTLKSIQVQTFQSELDFLL
jgi:hypothetical protein